MKTKGMHLLVAEKKFLLPTCYRTPTLFSDEFGSPKFKLFNSIKVKSPKMSWAISVHANDAALFQPLYRGDTIKHLRLGVTSSAQKVELIADHIRQILKNKPDKVLMSYNVTTSVAGNQL